MKKHRVVGLLLKVFLATTIFFPSAAWATEVPYDDGTQARMSWQSFTAGAEGAERLASLKKAITKMKSLDSSDPQSIDFRRSWAYWASIHGYYGPTSPDGTVQQQIERLEEWGMGAYTHFYQGIVDQNVPDSVAQATWATCQHGGPPGSFFGWHRMYMYYFEQVVRWAAEDETLRLPYWDYTDPAFLALPTEYQDTTSVFYDWRRDEQINTGAATLSSARTNINIALDDSDFFTYEPKIENGVHGYVHCTVGPTCPVADMGDVPVASNDPVFYLHHTNIDRTWACWQNLYPDPPGDWQNQEFSFPDASGNLQTKTIKEFLNSVPLGYTYDNATNCKRAVAPVLASSGGAGQGERKDNKLVTKNKITIDRPLTEVELGLPKEALRRAVAGMDPKEKMELVLHDITAKSPPGVLFDIFVARKGEPENRRLVGTISWFGVFGPHHGGHGAAKTLEFDITEAAVDFGGSELVVYFEATHGRTLLDVDKAETARKSAFNAFRAKAGLEIGAIELRKAPADPEP